MVVGFPSLTSNVKRLCVYPVVVLLVSFSLPLSLHLSLSLPLPLPLPHFLPVPHSTRIYKPLKLPRSQASHKQQKNLSCTSTCKLLHILIFPTKHYHQQPELNSSNMDKVGGRQPSFMDQLEMSHSIPRSSFVNKQLLPSFNTHPSDFLSQYLISSPLRNHTKRY